MRRYCLDTSVLFLLAVSTAALAQGETFVFKVYKVKRYGLSKAFGIIMHVVLRG